MNILDHKISDSDLEISSTCKNWDIAFNTSKNRKECRCGALSFDNGKTWYVLEPQEKSFDKYDIPKELQGILSYMAYERGHSAGEDEVNMTLNDLCSDLSQPIQDLIKRIKKESIDIAVNKFQDRQSVTISQTIRTMSPIRK